jgi:hypothetical protein
MFCHDDIRHFSFTADTWHLPALFRVGGPRATLVPQVACAVEESWGALPVAPPTCWAQWTGG